MARLAKDLFDHDEGNVETQLLKRFVSDWTGKFSRFMQHCIEF